MQIPRISTALHRIVALPIHYVVLAGLVLILAPMALLPDAETPIPQPVFPAPPSGNGPVVLELFTSQGCSSCPPAERLLPTLAESGEAPVIPLAYHVDYWDRLGWVDPFSDRKWTKRQQQYRAAFGASYVYTPQMVVNGRLETAGNEAGRIKRLVAQAHVYTPVAKPTLTLRRAPTELIADIRVQDLDRERAADIDVVAVLFERGRDTSVTAGENAGRTLHEEYVVRDLKRVMQLAPDQPAVSRVVFTLEANNRAREVGVAVLLQNSESLEIVGAAADSAPPLPEPARG